MLGYESLSGLYYVNFHRWSLLNSYQILTIFLVKTSLEIGDHKTETESKCAKRLLICTLTEHYFFTIKLLMYSIPYHILHSKNIKQAIGRRDGVRTIVI